MLVGVAVEYVHRADRYEIQEQSGSPESGTRVAELDGGGVGAAAGMRWEGETVGAHPWSVGAAVRLVPALELAGEQRWALLGDSGSAPIAARRQGTWEAGASLRYVLGPSFAALLALGGRGEQRWEGFGVAAREAFEWKLAGELHDRRDPWTVRFGGGMEQQAGVPEPRAGVFAVGLGWELDATMLEVGAMRRSLQRPGRPHSYEDRVVVSLRIDL